MEENKVEETKVEAPKKKKSGFVKLLYWLVVIGGCVFIFLGSYKIGYKLGNYFGDKKTESKTDKKSNENSNVATNDLLSAEEALNIGRDLYKKAITTYPSPLSGALESKCTAIKGPTTQGLDQYDCTSLYNELKTIYPENNEVFKNFKLVDGKYIYEAGGIGFVGKVTTTLSVKSIETDKIVFIAAIDLFNEPDKTTTQYNNEFVIVKENDTWKISSYEYLTGDNASISVVK